MASRWQPNGQSRVEGTCLFSCGGASLGIVGGEQVFEDLAEQFRVESDFLLDGGVFGNGEFVALEDVDEAADFGSAVASSAVGCAQVHLALGAEEQVVGNLERIIVAVGEAVDADVVGLFSGPKRLIEALEQAAVQNGMEPKSLRRCVGVLQEAPVAVEVVRHEVLAVLAELALVHLLIQRGEEEILQDGLVVGTFLGLTLVQQRGDLARVK